MGEDHCLNNLLGLNLIRRGIANDAELGAAFRFWSIYAEDHAEFRKYVIGSVQHVVLRLRRFDHTIQNQEWRGISWLCIGLSCAASNEWANPTLLDMDLCRPLFHILLCVVHALNHSLLFNVLQCKYAVN